MSKAMKNQSYAGQYFIGRNEDGDDYSCNGYDKGECVWQDGNNLLCVSYKHFTAGAEVGLYMVVPVRTAKHFCWFKTFAGFYAEVETGKPGCIVMDHPVPAKEYRKVRYCNPSDTGERADFRQVAALIRRIKEHPETGKRLADGVINAFERSIAKAKKIEELALAITAAGLSSEELHGLAKRVLPATPGGNFDDNIPF